MMEEEKPQNNEMFVSSMSLPEFPVWEKMRNQRNVISFDLELTARCNNDCRHCYINLPQNDLEAKKKEIPLEQIKAIVDQAVSLGALWCLLTGGEPLLREDFFEIYMYLKKKGLFISVFTNATLITQKHIDLFKKYPPRDIEVTVYGVTEATYEKVSNKKGSFKAFMRGLKMLLDNGIKVRYKAMAIRSNVHELPLISEFCRERTKDYFRFDPFLHLRFDANPKRNEEIKSERLSPKEIVAIEKADDERYGALRKGCNELINPEFEHFNCNHLFHCGTGNGSFTVSYEGYFRLCSSLWHPQCICDLKTGDLSQIWEKFVLQVRDLRSDNKAFLDKCRKCSLVNLCIWCPAHAHLETGKMDTPVEYFCEVAHARAEMIDGSPHK
ncbi:MAG: radical SAM protein [Candidatus Omnitrophica bacterium]|nr:radical SAM protein [Candidatus Omnitrophota bacterium]MDD5652613.1 radical SAM protein [Candidatus Omnitrophota bacterium]